MKKYVNGKYVEMTQEEIDEMNAEMPTISEQPKDALEERMEKIERAIDKVKTLFHID